MSRKLVRRTWTTDIQADEVQIRAHYQRLGKEIVRFTAQLEIWLSNKWQPVVRYDNAHGFCHRDTIHSDGSQDKSPVSFGDNNETFTAAIADLKENWEAHVKRFRRESRQ